MKRMEAEFLARWNAPDYTHRFTKRERKRRAHRRRVGGRWDELGTLQFEFLRSQGLQPGHFLLDIGCGALRGGVRFVDYLERRHYFGIDINDSMLDAGYEQELSEDLRAKLPRSNLRATERFDCDFGTTFDFALAQSLFTHLSLNQIRLCLYRVAKVVAPGGRFFATFKEAPPTHPLDEVLVGRRERIRYLVKGETGPARWTERDNYFYYRDDLRWASEHAPWEFHYIGAWGHSRGQRMVEFRRLDSGSGDLGGFRPQSSGRA